VRRDPLDPHGRLTKRLVDASAGVRELLWIVKPTGLVERWSGQGLNEAVEVTGTLTTPLLPGFEVEAAELYRSS
jgi:hypothetical protein